MKNRTYICRNCGELKRMTDTGRNTLSKRKHCDDYMMPLSHEQSYVATHLDMAKRLKWYSKGGFILKGPSGNKKWIPAFKAPAIREAIREEMNHRPKKPESYGDEICRVFTDLAQPYFIKNIEAVSFIFSIGKQNLLAEILFVSVKSFREELYNNMREHILNKKPEKYVREFISLLHGIVIIADEEIVNELKALWHETVTSGWKMNIFDEAHFLDRVLLLKNTLKEYGVAFR